MRKSFGDKIIDGIIVFFMAIIVIIMVYPLWNTLITSFNEARDSMKGSLYLWPRKWTLFNYQSVFKTDKIFKAFIVSVARTLITTIVGVFISGLFAYVA